MRIQWRSLGTDALAARVPLPTVARTQEDDEERVATVLWGTRAAEQRGSVG